MNRHLPPFLALALLPLAPLAQAEILGARPLPPRSAVISNSPSRAAPVPPWPRPAPPPPTVTLPRIDDDRPGYWFQVQFPAQRVNFDAALLTDWRRALPPERYSLEWTGRWLGDVRIGATQLPPTQLPNLSDVSWRAYLTTLQRTFLPRATLTLDDDSEKNRDMTRVLGVRSRVARFEIPPVAEDAKPTQLLIVAVEFPAGVLAFTCDGPASNVAIVAQAFERLITRAELPET